MAGIFLTEQSSAKASARVPVPIYEEESSRL
jgi:hypothetical protein